MLQVIIVCNFKENYLTKLEKIAKNLILEPILAPLDQIRAQIFFHKFYLYFMPQIVARFPVCNFKENYWTKFEKIAKNLISRLILAPLDKIRAQKIFTDFISTSWYTLLQATTVCNIKENWWSKLEKIAKNLVSGPILAPLDQIRTQKIFS